MEWWGYGPIRDIHLFMEHLPETPLSDDLKAVRMGEARFLRAFSYFTMVKRYGGVPVITKAQSMNDPEEELYPPRNSEMDTYDFILRELDDIINDLPDPSVVETGRPSKSAALALKCRVALYAGSTAQFGKIQLGGLLGIPAEKAGSYYQTACDAADRIIQSGWHQLYNQDADKVANFKNIFLNENNSEVIFVKPHNEVNGLAEGNGWCVDFMQCPYPQGWSAGNETAPYLEMVEEFEYIDGRPGKLDYAAIQQGVWTIDELWKDKDPRFFATVYTQNTPWQGDFVDFHRGILRLDGNIQLEDSYNGVLANGTTGPGTGFGVMKYLNEAHDNMAGTNSGWATSWQDWVIFRYAEILLNYAEAAFELGREGDALNAINQIRARAGIAPLTSVDRMKIRHERKVELAFEGHRYWDLRRWRTATIDLSRDFSGLQYILDYSSYAEGEKKYRLMIIEKVDGTVSSPLFREENYYFPITLTRTSNNPQLVENPGYR
ncbi:MAG: RagB/SusD family nutrient uptake outer membrane protein, partial [Prevotellaceae bacterium]|jgi:hypothetical protein|nr:RagB/SusD family nutrient uptake outer membrane protein [Prevotellaceae bacterium]